MRVHRPRRCGHRPRESGFALLEVFVAAILLIIVFLGLAQTYWRGRREIDYEEDRRKATAVLQARFDGIRRDYRYRDLPLLDSTRPVQTDTTYVVDGRNFIVSHSVTQGVPEPQATTLTFTVTWKARVGTTQINRSLSATSILGRGMP
jgi:Tfp pilus assembly protein PilV